MAVLIVDDSAYRQRQIRSVVARLGHRSSRLESVTQTQEAVAALRRRSYEYCFICVTSPAREWRAVVAAANAGTANRSLRMIAYGGGVTEALVLEAAKLRIGRFLSYPFTLADVEFAIQPPR